MTISGVTMSGNNETGSIVRQIAPTITVSAEMTIATIGRSMKNLVICGGCLFQRFRFLNAGSDSAIQWSVRVVQSAESTQRFVPQRKNRLELRKWLRRSPQASPQ